MVQTDISQLSKECNQWRESLHSLRDEFNKLKHELQNVANKALSKDQLTGLEHYQNQLHIQLINIHDLKQAVKSHDKKSNTKSRKIKETLQTILMQNMNIFMMNIILCKLCWMNYAQIFTSM